MENILDKINLLIDKLFDAMEQACSFCYEKLSIILNHAFAWAIALGITLLFVVNIYVFMVE